MQLEMIYNYTNTVNFSILKDKKVIKVIHENDNGIIFICENNEGYLMYHEQDCCEEVTIDDIEGDLTSLEGQIITLAEVESSTNVDCEDDESEDSYTWTFYKLASIKGYITIKWYGESTGFYSEDVDFIKLDTTDEELMNGALVGIGLDEDFSYNEHIKPYVQMSQLKPKESDNFNEAINKLLEIKDKNLLHHLRVKYLMTQKTKDLISKSSEFTKIEYDILIDTTNKIQDFEITVLLIKKEES